MQVMPPEELLGYFEIHSKTERALFHWTHIRDLCQLADVEVPKGLDRKEFWAVFWDTCEPLLKAARKRLRELMQKEQELKEINQKLGIL